MGRDFTLAHYGKLIQVLRARPGGVYGVAGWLRDSPAAGLLLRHDVDRWPRNALRVAELEQAHGISSTFYFRSTAGSFNPSVIRSIAALGHEIGYHYEDLSLARGDFSQAILLFQRHLSRLRELAPVTTISMHGRPLSAIDNRDLWNHFDYRDYGLAGEAFLSIDYTDIYYFTDTGRSWAAGVTNLRDRVNSRLTANVRSTGELLGFLAAHPTARIAVVSHPERWPGTLWGYVRSLLTDTAANQAKLLLRQVRRGK